MRHYVRLQDGTEFIAEGPFSFFYGSEKAGVNLTDWYDIDDEDKGIAFPDFIEENV